LWNILLLDVSPTDLARKAFATGLDPVVRNIAKRKRKEAVQTLKRLKIAKA
jgi:hypothetical protein